MELRITRAALFAFVVARWTGASLGAVGMLGIRGGALLGPVPVAVGWTGVLPGAANALKVTGGALLGPVPVAIGLAEASLGAVGMLEIRGAVVSGQGGRRLKASILAS